MTIGRELREAYERAVYRVAGPEGGFVLRHGERCAAAEAVVRAAGERVWAFVTAANPGSVVLGDAENAERNAALEAVLAERGYGWLPGEGGSEAGDWPVERSYFVIGMGREEALEVGRMFGQAAVLVGEVDGVAEVVLPG